MNGNRAIEELANAVLYEGFLLYPYRLSSVKNRHRWNFGVIHPEPFASRNFERSGIGAECLLRSGAACRIDVKVRFLHLTAEKTFEREVEATGLEVSSLVTNPMNVPISFQGIEGVLHLASSITGSGEFKVLARVTNSGRYEGDNRDEALTHSLISAHILLSISNGTFISLIDPPETLRNTAQSCRNEGLWPVLASGDDTVVLAAPIILEDHPRIAPQSPGNLFDGTEIDEILTLRIRTLTDGEKAEMRDADERANNLLQQCENLTRDQLARLHAPMQRDSLGAFSKGDRVRLRPCRRADIFDIALAGKLATIISIEHDFDGGAHFCVTLDDDPGRDLGLEGKPGHRFFFGQDEVEPA